MRINPLLFLIVLTNSLVCAQNTEISIVDLKPIAGDNKFPEIHYQKNLKAETKINTALQLEHLEHLPNRFKNNPFEKVMFDEKNCCGYVNFYEWEKHKTPQNILSITINGEASGAYPEEFEQHHNFDVRTGNQILLKNIFSSNGLAEITKTLNLKVKNRIQNYLSEIKDTIKNNNLTTEEKERIDDQITLYESCLQYVEDTNLAYEDYYFEKDSMQFVRGRCSNHAMRALDDLYNFKNSFSYKTLEKYLSTYGADLIKGSSENKIDSNPESKFYKGKINNKYAITVFLSRIYADSSLDMQYWYDKKQIPIAWNGNFINNHFSLVEYDKYDEEKQVWIIKASIEADLFNNKIIGTWTNNQTKEVFKLALTEY